MPRRIVGNRDLLFSKQGRQRGLTPEEFGEVSSTGGPAMHSSIMSYGGIIVVVQDVTVPAMAAGPNTNADWTTAGYAGPSLPSATELPLFSYSNPIDTSLKLNTKGTFMLLDAWVLYGTGVTGAAAPYATTIGGEINFDITLKRGSGGSTMFNWNGNVAGGWATPASGQVGFLFPNETKNKGHLIGNDSDGGMDEVILTMQNDHATNAILTGRLRFVLMGCEL